MVTGPWPRTAKYEREAQETAGDWGKSPGYELSLAVATKLRVIRVVASRFNADLAELSKHLDAMPEKVEQAVTERLALTLPSDDLGFRLAADVDAFLFETWEAKHSS